ncbi:MAG: UPF0182 family protein [Coleofasciculaceae cyanobacterium]
MKRKFQQQIFRFVTCLVGLFLVWDLLSNLVAEILWFREVGYLAVLLLRLKTQLIIWVVAFSISSGFLFGNLFLANRLKYPNNIFDSEQPSASTNPFTEKKGKLHAFTRPLHWQRTTPAVRKRLSSTLDESPANSSFLTLTLRSLLPVVLLLSFLVGLMLLHYGKTTLAFWHPDFNLPKITPNLPAGFDWSSAGEILLQQVPEQIWLLGIVVTVVVLLIINAQFGLKAIALVLSVLWSLVLAGYWGRILRFFYPTTFSSQEPLFGNDVSFYVFKLPMWQLLDFWLGGLFLFALVAVVLTYLVSGDSLSQGKFPGFSQFQLRHLYGLSSLVVVILALRYWLSRYGLLYSNRGVTYGASYTDVTVQLPVNTILSILAVAIAIFLLLRTIFWSSLRLRKSGKVFLALFGLYVAAAVIAGLIVPSTVQRFGVQPNELEREKPYIERSIALTRKAFDLNSIEVKTFDPEGELTSTELAENRLTIRNIRLWDTRPILQTNRQLQRIRPYYEFPDADIDRYTLKAGATGVPPSFEGSESEQENASSPSAFSSSSTTTKQQVLIAPRELDYQDVPEEAKTWVNKHLFYTHGYGFTLSPVNTADDGGLPNYFVKDIGTGREESESGALFTSSPLIRDSIPIGKPRIYYGELTNTYVMTPTETGELDYPSGEDNVYNTYDGSGGIAIGSVWRRLLFAQYLKDWQMLFTGNFTPQTKMLFRRNINERIRAIAPFLRYDGDPYIVTADARDGESGETENYLYWIVDAYTTSNHYPYSDPGQNSFNYIRNSVKVVIDAYSGKVTFYVADPQDPIIQTWNKIFPNLFKPLDVMPLSLRVHIRYPVDIFSIQSERLLKYHMTDPQVFYNREDLWRIPQEIYGNESQAVDPYYLIMKLPAAKSEEFVLLHPYTPARRNNLIAWLAGRSDGDQYGKLLLYQFPKQELIYGPEQIEALINQDPEISRQISLWNRQGSKAVQGNLLVIPIERSLLYVEPLYLEADRNSLPTLVRVIVVYENQIVMAPTLEASLQAIFEPEQKLESTIVRPVEGSAVP